jgi:hypothetical protein
MPDTASAIHGVRREDLRQILGPASLALGAQLVPDGIDRQEDVPRWLLAITRHKLEHAIAGGVDGEVLEVCQEALRQLSDLGITHQFSHRPPTVGIDEWNERVESGEISQFVEDVRVTLGQLVQLRDRALELRDLVRQNGELEALVLSYDDLLTIDNLFEEEGLAYFLYISPERKYVCMEILFDDDDMCVLNAFEYDRDQSTRGRKLYGPIYVSPDDTFVMFPEHFGNHNLESAPAKSS